MEEILPQRDSSQYTCSYLDHEGENIIGFCLFDKCHESSVFCAKCVTKDNDKYHVGHQKDYLISITDIYKDLDKGRKNLKQDEVHFKELNYLMNEISHYINKLFLQKSDQLLIKIQTMMRKVDHVIQNIFQKIELLTILEKSIYYQKHEYLNDKIKQTGKFLLHQQKYILVGTIDQIKQKQNDLIQKLKSANLQQLNYKAAQIYLLKGFNIFSQVSRKDLIEQALNYLNQTIIRNPELIMAQICKWKALKSMQVNQSDKRINDSIINFIQALILEVINPSFQKAFHLSVIRQNVVRINRGERYQNNFSIFHHLLDGTIQLKTDDAKTNFQKDFLNKILEFWRNIQFRSIFQQHPMHDATIRIKPLKYLHYKQKGKTLHNQSNEKMAIKYYDEAIQLKPNDTTLNNEKTKLQQENSEKDAIHEVQIEQGEINGSEEDIDDEINGFDEEINQQYNNGFQHYLKGSLLARYQQYQEAIDCYDEAISLRPQEVGYYFYKGKVLEKMEKYQEAINCFDQAINLKPNEVKCYLAKGKILARLQQYQEANNCYDQAISLGSKQVDYYLQKGKVLEKLNQFQRQLIVMMRQQF